MSDAPDAAEAGSRAARQALSDLGGEPAALVLVYTSFDADLPAVLASIRTAVGDAPLVGAAACGQFANGAAHVDGRGVAVLALTSGPYRYGVALAQDTTGDLDGLGRQLARASRAAAGDAPYGAIVLLTDWLIGDQQQLIQGMYRATGPGIPIVGGAASGEVGNVKSTRVFYNDQMLERAAAAIWIASEHPLKVITQHGWEPTGVPMLVGRVEGTCVMEMNGKAAARAYAEQLGVDESSIRSSQDFWNLGLHHPLAILQPDGSLLIRAVIARTLEGGLNATAHVPVGCAVHVTSGTPDSLLDCVEPLVEQVLEERDDAQVIMTFSCAARAQVLGERAVEEAERLQRAAGQVSTFGFWTFGEFGRTAGVLGTHSATLTAIAL